jgi:endoglucanase Acf2
MTKFTTIYFAAVLLVVLLAGSLHAQVVTAGHGSYTRTFPGTDTAGRNGYPSGSPQLSGAAAGKPVPTNDWWSKLIKENHADNLFNYPYTLKTLNEGLVVSYIPRGVIDDQLPVVVGVSGLSAGKTTVSNYSDWTVTMNWNDGTRFFEATSGIAMPFLYFTKGTNDVAAVKVNLGTVSIQNEMLVISNARNGADFAIYAPAGSTWIQNGNLYTSTLNGKNYWSMAFIPLSATNVAAVASEYKKFAYVFPATTTAGFSYNETTSVVRTDFVVQPDVKEGIHNSLLLGLLPHQWANLAADSPQPSGYSYASIRGEIKTLEGNNFSVENKFKGILPTLPYVSNYSAGFNPAALNEKVTALENDQLATWTDSYNEGQVMNRLIQTARIAHETGNFAARDKMLQTVKSRLENWLKAESGEKAFLFYYNANWSALLGYPAGHGQDTNLNDHHFHWGYFIHAAAFLEQFEPGWAQQFGPMIELLVRDAASTDRTDPLFPYLRNFSPFAGHSWANGFATFPQGNDQESTSESMQFNSSLIHWGTITGNKAVRDLGIYLYTTEQTAVEEYWFDIHDRNFPASQTYSLVSRVWGNNFDNGTFWTSDIAASYGIELYPVHGGSLYLGHHAAYAEKLWNEIKATTGISSNQANDNLWHDVMWKYSAFTNPAEAIGMYNSYPARNLKFGISDAQTYYWLHAMNALGKVDATITANYPIAAVFNNGSRKAYVAHNYGTQPITVLFSDGYQLEVPAGRMITNLDVDVEATLSSSFTRAYPGGSVELSATITRGNATKVEFYNGSNKIAEAVQAPFSAEATDLSIGIHSIYARIYSGENFTTTNSIRVQVGEQAPYGNNRPTLPGSIEAGHYDRFEGGSGQNIAYFDLSPGNNGDFRKEESVDASYITAEGATVGWIDAGEWLEYSVNVAESGMYSLAFRYASGNSAGGGPFTIRLNDEEISGAITVPSTSSTVWSIWATKTVTNLPLTAGNHVLKLNFASGEFNLGRMTFTRTGNLPYSIPIANAGPVVKVVLPETTAKLDASASSETGGKNLTFNWIQLFGPSVATISNPAEPQPTIGNLREGMYKFKLSVTNSEQRSSTDEVLVMVTTSANAAPTVSITSPATNTTFRQGDEITVTAAASDFDGTLQLVEFYQNNKLIGSDDTAPYSITWKPAPGNYSLTATAIDNENSTGTSQPVNITVAEVNSCTLQSTTASQGSFSNGYILSWETVNNDVTITWELLDEKAGVVAYLWTQTPFSEKQLTSIGTKKFQTTLSNQTPGATLTFACKFAFAGGMAVTSYHSYQVGKNCNTTSVEAIEPSHRFFYPNPVKNVMTLMLEPGDYSAQIYSLSGVKWMEIPVDSNNSIDLSILPAGIYLIQIENQHQQIHRAKFSKE